MRNCSSDFPLSTHIHARGAAERGGRMRKWLTRGMMQTDGKGGIVTSFVTLVYHV